jgi:carbamoyl-phosphate synthase large subunit
LEKKKDKILITAIGSEAGRFVISSYKKLGFEIIGTDIYFREILPNAKQVDVFYQVPLVTDRQGYINALSDICRKENIQFLIPLTDPEVDVLSGCHQHFQGFGTKICTENEDTIRILRDKYAWYTHLTNEAGINTIPTYRHFDAFQKHCGVYPMVAKPVRGRSSEGLYKANAKDELPLVVQQSESYIFQPWLDGDIIVSDVLATGESLVAAIHRMEWLRSKNGMGTAVELFQDETLTQMLSAVLRKIPFRGSFNIESLRLGGKYYIMDINPRFSAGVAFSGLVGYDFAEQHLNLYRDMPYEKLFNNATFFAVKQYNEIFMNKDNFFSIKT